MDGPKDLEVYDDEDNAAILCAVIVAAAIPCSFAADTVAQPIRNDVKSVNPSVFRLV